MSAQTFNYDFNLSSNAAGVAAITQHVASLNTQIDNSTKAFKRFSGTVETWNQIAQAVQGVSSAMDEIYDPGAALNASLADLSVLTGLTGEGLEGIGEHARAAAEAFGGSAAQGVERFKLLMEQLSPELAKAPQALRVMGDNVATLSKTMQGDTTAAAEVLTTAMNQYGVSLADPMEASRKMTEMMNIMAAAGKLGGAHLPAIKQALEQCGSAAKGAQVSFAETNASIQVLDRAGRKGAEGGEALRRVMEHLAAGRFLPEEVRAELTAAGVDVEALADRSKTLAQRLEPLKAVMSDSALFARLFGSENSDAAKALVQGTAEIERYTEAISGTNTAVEQAAIVMASYPERQARVKAWFDDFKISVFNLTGDVGLWVSALADAALPLAQLMPLLEGVGKGMKMIREIDFADVRSSIARMGAGVVTACRAVGAAIMGIPILGWIAAAVAGLVALGVYFWNTSTTFRAVLKGLGAAFVATFGGIWTLAKEVFGSIGDLVMAAFSLDGKGIKDAIDRLKGGFSEFGANVGAAFDTAYNAEMARGAARKTAEAASAEPGLDATAPQDGGAISQGLTHLGGTAGSGGKGGSVTVHIEKLIDRFEIHTTNLHDDLSRVRDLVAEALTGAVNDVKYAM